MYAALFSAGSPMPQSKFASLPNPGTSTVTSVQSDAGMELPGVTVGSDMGFKGTGGRVRVVYCAAPGGYLCANSDILQACGVAHRQMCRVTDG